MFRLTVKEAQTLLKARGFYTGNIDGIIGNKTKAATRKAKSYAQDQGQNFDLLKRHWPYLQKLVAVIQALLNMDGHDAGIVDGVSGNETRNAYNDWLYQHTHGRPEDIPRVPQKEYDLLQVPTQSECDTFFGKPGPEVESRLVCLELPYTMKLDWSLREKVDTITIHKKVAPYLSRALSEVKEHYGKKIKALGLDRFAGSYNHRTMRGGTQWSTHAYGCAVDFFAQPNGLRTRCPEALFCGAEYKAFLDIMERNNMLPAIRLWGADAMHFQFARLG